MANTVKLYSVKDGKMADWALSIGLNSEIVATHGDEFLKFPAGLKRSEFDKLVKKHNEANEGVKALTDEEIEAQEAEQAASEALIDSFDDGE